VYLLEQDKKSIHDININALSLMHYVCPSVFTVDVNINTLSYTMPCTLCPKKACDAIYLSIIRILIARL